MLIINEEGVKYSGCYNLFDKRIMLRPTTNCSREVTNKVGYEKE